MNRTIGPSAPPIVAAEPLPHSASNRVRWQSGNDERSQFGKQGNDHALEGPCHDVTDVKQHADSHEHKQAIRPLLNVSVEQVAAS